jgi:hypothetical protein
MADASLVRYLRYAIHGETKHPRRARRRRRSARSPRYLAFVRKLPCLVCYREFWGWWLNQGEAMQGWLVQTIEELPQGLQNSPTEAAHIGMSDSCRGIAQQYPDAEAGPLCRGHHREFKDAHHAGSRGWWRRTFEELDRDQLLSALVRVYEGQE